MRVITLLCNRIVRGLRRFMVLRPTALRIVAPNEERTAARAWPSTLERLRRGLAATSSSCAADPVTDMDEVVDALQGEGGDARAAHVVELHHGQMGEYSARPDWRISQVSKLDVFVNLRVVVLMGNAAGVARWAPRLPHLQRLELADWWDLTELDVSDTPSLTRLEVRDSPLEQVQVAACARLQTLCLSGSDGITPRFVVLDLRGCVALEELELAGECFDCDLSHIEVQAANCTRLRRLDLESYDGQKYRVHLPAGLALEKLGIHTSTLNQECIPVAPASVRELVLYGCLGFTVDLSQPFLAPVLSTVKSLSVHEASTHESDVYETTFSFIIPPATLRNLEAIEVASFHGVHYGCYEEVDFRECTRVRKLTLTGDGVLRNVLRIRGPPSLRECNVRGILSYRDLVTQEVDWPGLRE